jgi:hypothetical protein
MIKESPEGARVTMPAAATDARPSPASDWLVAGDQSLESTFTSEMQSTLSFVLTGFLVCN